MKKYVPNLYFLLYHKCHLRQANHPSSGTSCDVALATSRSSGARRYTCLASCVIVVNNKMGNAINIGMHTLKSLKSLKNPKKLSLAKLCILL